MNEKKSLVTLPSRGEGQAVEHDAVFGTIADDGPNYRNVGWIGTTILMIKTQVGLGVLSIPSTFNTFGIVPGVICLCCVAAITTWSDYIVGNFKLQHREIYGIDDVGQLIFGRVGRIVMGAAFVLWWTFAAGSAILGASISLNAITSHATCTAVFVAIAAIAVFSFASIQTLGRISWIAWGGLACLFTAVVTVTIAIGVRDRPAAAPQTGIWIPNYKIVNSPSFSDACTGLSTIVFSYAGTSAFFSIAAEMRDPRYYSRSLIICQSFVSAFYLTVGVVIYYYCGSYISSPVLGSAGATIKKVCYGFALPGLIATSMLSTHLAGKFIFVRILQGSTHLTANTLKHWVAWLGCTMGVTLVAYIVASAVPIFEDLVSLVGALFGVPLCFQPMAAMWIYDNWNHATRGSMRWYLMVAWCAFIALLGTFLMIAGTYGSIVNIIDDYKTSGGSTTWSCTDNSNP